MRALTFVEKGKLEWRDAPDPKLEGDRQALVRPVALATCDIDAAFVQGLAPVGGSVLVRARVRRRGDRRR